MLKKKNMKLGNKNFLIIIIISILTLNFSLAEEKIISTPLINVEEIKPSFETLEEENESISTQNLKEKKDNKPLRSFQAILIGLDKITAKTIPIKIKLGETAKFGILEIKALKCGFSKSSEINNNSAAYLQVRDMSESQNEKVFIFNGWTFASDPSIAPFDHAIYDLQLVNCNNV